MTVAELVPQVPPLGFGLLAMAASSGWSSGL
jgi:hypothetical protein